MKKLLLLLCLPGLSFAQEIPADRFKLRHTVFAGVQLPLNYVAGYRLQFSRRLSAQLQGGLIAAPFDRYTLKTLEAFGLDPQLSQAIDRSFRQGSSVSAGLNVHANSPWYAGVFGQYVHLAAGPITPADALGVYFQRDFSGFGLLDSPTFVFTMQSNIWMGGLRVGRSIRFGPSRFGLNVEASIGKIFGTRNTFSSNRPFVDGLGVTQRLYGNLNSEVDSQLRRHGYLPTLNLLLTYRLSHN
ncbi:hypothetical protein [Spirosoma validum]|uniref:YjbH domain-containing protein n=1 Tax=Spirosoma validum TaxID=2771355 RepID=A0A927B8H7_9BACT|nr:hypothetical protein [Spirosoma validum]MBD2757425.1 hypothetical protein [Spirosoma validum]